METTIIPVADYITSARKQFAYYKMLGEKTFSQLSDDQLFWKYNDESNSIAVIVQHLSGNMLSRWTDFFTTDGEKEWRNREEEFKEGDSSRLQMMRQWTSGWEALFNALDSVNADNIHTTVYIRNQGHTVTEAINRQLAHYPYHIGQIVFIGKMALNSRWSSLSIPKGASEAYNAEKFSQPKRREHFSDEYRNDFSA